MGSATNYATDEPRIATIADWHFDFDFFLVGSRAFKSSGSSSPSNSGAEVDLQAGASGG
jgi:hypothetical protein